MSPASDQRFSTWFPAIVVGLVISLIAAALWDILRRRTWTFVSRFWPGVLGEVGLDHRTRVEVEQEQRAVTNELSELSPQIITALANPPNRSLMAQVSLGPSSSSTDYDVEAQIGMNPLYRPFGPSNNTTVTTTAYFLDGTPTVIIERTLFVFNKYGIGTTKQWKSSIVLQASLPVDPVVLAEIGELAKDCLHAENRCTFQLGNWAILYYNAGNVHMRELTEGDVPVNVEARWQEKRAGITMSGLYLTGAQVKVATEQISVTLRDDGPAAQGLGDLDELFFPTDQVDVPEDDSFIHASKVVQADGISLIVRSEASRILPPWEKSLREIIWDRLQRISLSAEKMIKSLLRIEDQQLPELLTSSGRDLENDLEHFELLAEHWKGVSEIELLGTRKEVLYHLHELLRFKIGECTDPQPSCDLFPRPFIGDQYSLKYWQRGLHDLNRVILFWNCQQNLDALQYGLYLSIRGGIKFLLADPKGAIQDFDLACNAGDGSMILFDRALAKCVLARYSEAMEDVVTVIASNRSLNDIQELQTCLQQILHQRRVRYGPFSQQRPDHSDQRKSEPIMIPDLLTGGEWCPVPKDDAPPCAQYDTTSNSNDTNVHQVLEVGGFSGHTQHLDTCHVLLQDHVDLESDGAPLLEDQYDLCSTFPKHDVTASKQPLSKSIDKTPVLQDSTDDDETKTRRQSLCLVGVPGITKSARCDDFVKDVSNLAGLSHPNVTRFLSFATDDEKCSMVMESMDEDLSSLIQRRMKTHEYPFEIPEAVDIMHQLGGAMHTTEVPGEVPFSELSNDKELWRKIGPVFLSHQPIPLLPTFSIDICSSPQARERDPSFPRIIRARMLHQESIYSIRARMFNMNLQTEPLRKDHIILLKMLKETKKRDSGDLNSSNERLLTRQQRSLMLHEYQSVLEPENQADSLEQLRDQTAGDLIRESPRPHSDLEPELRFHVEGDESETSTDVPLYISDSDFSDGRVYVVTLTEALEACVTHVQEFHNVLPSVEIFTRLCTSLVETVSYVARANFERYRAVLDLLHKMDPEDAPIRRNLRNSISFCFESLVGLARRFQLVEELLRKCGSPEWYKSALELADVRPLKHVTRWSEFSLLIRNCGWSLDIVELAFHALEKLLTEGQYTVKDASFKWSSEKGRMVLQILGKLDRHDTSDESKKWRAMEEDDMVELVEKLEGLVKSEQEKKHLFRRGTSSAEGIARFLSEKLRSPTPEIGTYVPYSFSKLINPSNLKYETYLGKGSSGMVAVHDWFGMKVAVKSVRAIGLSRAKFVQEAAVLAMAQHPNVVRLIGCGFLESPYGPGTGQLVMELMDHDLRSIIEYRQSVLPKDSSPFSPMVAIDLLLQIVQAMLHLHENCVLHQDLKTVNVCIRPNTSFHRQEYGVLKLADFGLARCRPQSSYVTIARVGTTAWRAPEIFHLPDSELANEHKWPADVYSFAMTAYEVLTGKLPFDEELNYSLYDKIMAGKRPSFENLRQEFPEAVKELIQECWATDPKDRPNFEDIVKRLWECKVLAILSEFERKIMHTASASASGRFH